ncbi:MAG TPA: HD domain-containing protein [Acidimicrobiia bacterium]
MAIAGHGVLGEATHLVRRFFGYLRARPLAPREQHEVRDALGDGLAPLFFAQHPADQRHGVEMAARVAAALPQRDDAFVAALVHDVGKVAAGLGPVRRSLATLLDLLHVPMPVRYRRYRDHGAVGAELLDAAGAPPLAVAFARDHPGVVPEGVDPLAWDVLEAADRASDRRAAGI